MSYPHHTWAEIDLAALAYNLRQVRELVGAERKILAVVKAQAYGHGALPVSRKLQSIGADLLGVANISEGVELREAGIRLPILLLSGPIEGALTDVVRCGLTPVIYDLGTARRLNQAGEKAGRTIAVHVKVDTGMGRLGCLPDEAPELLRKLRALPYLEPEGVMTHLACAEAKDRTHTKHQLSRFDGVLARLSAMEIRPPLAHSANSAAILNHPASWYDLVRPGLVLYGASPDIRLKDKINLRPVLTVKTRVLQLKQLPPGSALSYCGAYITARKSRIAILPLGYADGYPRCLSNSGYVLIKGRKAPIVGRVCMDLTLVDVTDLPPVEVGDEVLVMGKDKSGELPVEEVAQLAGTIPYELLCGIGNALPRVYQ